MIKEPKIEMTGKEYLEYRKYKDARSKQRWKAINKWLHINISLVVSCVVAICVTFLVIFAISTIQAAYVPEPEPFVYTWQGIAMFLAICAGLGWVFHGVGFAIIGKLS